MRLLASGSVLMQSQGATSQPNSRKPNFRRQCLHLHFVGARSLFFVSHVAAWVCKSATGRFLHAISCLPDRSPSLRFLASRPSLSRHEISGLQESTAPADRLAKDYASQHSGIRPNQLSDNSTQPHTATNLVTFVLLACAPRPGVESPASSYRGPSINSPVRSSHSSIGSSPHDPRLCVVCDAASCRSCPVCDQHFCSNHLYICSDCDNQYCGNCLDEHRADGHWSDSDTAAELSSTQRLGSGEDTLQGDQGVCVLAAGTPSTVRPSGRTTLTRFTSLLVFLLRSVCRSLLRCLLTDLEKHFPQPIVPPEVCL